jgi:hypothetical protein
MAFNQLMYITLLYLVPVNFGFIPFVRRKSTLSQAFFNKRYFASLTCVFILRHSSNWNPRRLHPEPFPPKENHNVGPLRFDDDHDHICFSLRRFEYLAKRSNVFRSLQSYCYIITSKTNTGKIKKKYIKV